MISKSTLKKLYAEQDGNALIDWAVLVSGALLMAVAVILTVADRGLSYADGMTDRNEVVDVISPGAA